MPKFIDLTGKVFARLTVTGQAPRKRKGIPLWHCKCCCGNEIITKSANLNNGHTRSCGCLKNGIFRTANTTHGMHKHHLYRVWQDMMKRCNREDLPQYKNYGGRGIQVCEEWKDPSVFLRWAVSNYSEGLFLDREDNDKGYSEDNCRFVTRSVNNCNKRVNERNETGYTGVRMGKSGKFIACISSSVSIYLSRNGRYLGSFDTPEQAVQARNDFIIKHGLDNKIQEIKCQNF